MASAFTTMGLFTQPNPRPSTPLLGVAAGLPHCALQRQSNCKSYSTPKPGLDVDPALVPFHDHPADGEPQAQSVPAIFDVWRLHRVFLRCVRGSRFIHSVMQGATLQ